MALKRKAEQAMGARAGGQANGRGGRRTAARAQKKFDPVKALKAVQAAEERMSRLRQIDPSSLEEPFTV